MRPIPRNLLIHTGTIKEVSSTDNWGVETTTSAVELTKVRFEPYKKLIRSKNNLELQTNTLMFYDCTNSRPKNQTFTTDTIISVNGEEKKVVAIEQLYDNNKLHHYELYLA